MVVACIGQMDDEWCSQTEIYEAPPKKKYVSSTFTGVENTNDIEERNTLHEVQVL